jgi:amino acid transporter
VNSTEEREAGLEPDAIGVVQDTIIGMASSAPAATVGLSLFALVAATAYGSGPILILTAIPMLIIANSYRRLNLWQASSGASFEWVGRAINPYLGFLTGWLMVAAYIIGTVAEVLLLGPSVLAVFGSDSANTWAYVGIGVAVGLIMLVIAVVGIKITARTQVGMALVEYLILVGLAIAGVVFVASHHAGTVSFGRGWLSLSGVGGKGDVVAGFLAAVFVYGGWDGTLYVNEEVRQRRVNPGRAAVIAVALLAVIYTLAQVGFQGVVSYGRLSAASRNGTALVYVASAMGGGFWAKAMALAIALSVIATTGTGIVLSARIVYGMASHRTLPPVLARVNPRYQTPAVASVIAGLLIVVLSAVYFLATSVENAFYDVIDVLHPDRGGHHGVLPPPGGGQRAGLPDPGPAAAGCGGVPGLDPGPLGPARAVVAAVVVHRGGGGRPGADGRRAGGPAVAVLPAAPRERRPVITARRI